VVLKENILRKHYTDSAFLLKSNTAYRSLFWRLVESLESLSIRNRSLNQGGVKAVGRGVKTAGSGWGSASRLPPDSRVPKSSSVPAKIMEVVSNPPAEEERRRPSLLDRAITNRGE
jgi:hypothetical protein